jgi:hypothetical protein
MATGWSAKIFEKSRPKNFLRIVIFTLAFSVLINMFSLANAPADDSHFLIMKNLWDGWRAFGARHLVPTKFFRRRYCATGHDQHGWD